MKFPDKDKEMLEDLMKNMERKPMKEKLIEICKVLNIFYSRGYELEDYPDKVDDMIQRYSGVLNIPRRAYEIDMSEQSIENLRNQIKKYRGE